VRNEAFETRRKSYFSACKAKAGSVRGGEDGRPLRRGENVVVFKGEEITTNQRPYHLKGFRE